jgi:hypothetical protein
MENESKYELDIIFSNLKDNEIKEFERELERDEQLREDFCSASSKREQYQIARPYFDTLTLKDFKKIKFRFEAKEVSQKVDLKYIAGGSGESIIEDRNGQVFFGSGQAARDTWQEISNAANRWTFF